MSDEWNLVSGTRMRGPIAIIAGALALVAVGGALFAATQQSVEPVHKATEIAAVASQDSPTRGSNSAQPTASRDNFDIPWPGGEHEATTDQVDTAKLQKIIREHNKLYAQWKRERHNYQELSNRLTKIGTNLQGLINRADAVGQTMNKIRGVLGDQNLSDAEIFAPPETPRWVQSLSKTYTLRTGEMGRLNAKATRAVNDFNATLTKLDANVANQRQTLSRATELRGE